MAVTTWTFTDDFEGWSFNDTGSDPGSSSRTHVSGAIKTTLTYPASPPNTRDAQANHVSPRLEAPIENGDTIEVDSGAVTGTAGTTAIKIIATYTDTTIEEQNFGNSGGANTKTLTLTQSKTLDFIIVEYRINQSSPSAIRTENRNLLEVRLTTASPLPVPIGGAGEKAMEIDLDLDTGAKRWVTFWNAGAITLQEYSTALAVQNTFSFTTGTVVSSIESREYYMSPYAPPFFGTASLDDIIYIYGRWDDGTVRHLQKSVNGGSSFSDIGDSGTWDEGWVGGFFADDALILFAFVNGNSRSLYRSIDAGSSWTSLSSLPFDVEPGGVSKHPDGRILISNRDAGSQTAAYAEAPDYSSWIDATGSPSFPTTTPGAGSNAIIWIT